MCQGNGALPAAWMVITNTIIAAHKRKGHGTHLIAPIPKTVGHLVDNLYINETDLIHLDMRSLNSVKEAHKRFQASVHNWGELLLVKGGALKPAKCSHYQISFQLKPYGTWTYCLNKNKENPQRNRAHINTQRIENVGLNDMSLGVQ
jgi:hypothetical protein